MGGVLAGIIFHWIPPNLDSGLAGLIFAIVNGSGIATGYLYSFYFGSSATSSVKDSTITDLAIMLDATVGVEASAALTADPGAHLEPRLSSVLRAVGEGRDTLASLAGAPDQAQPMLAALTELELLGLLRRVPGGWPGQ